MSALSATRTVLRLGKSSTGQLDLPTSPRESVRSTPLRVVLASTQKRWHGGEQQAALLAGGLRNEGHQCCIFARNGSEFATRMSQAGFDVTTFAGKARGPRQFWQARRRLRELKPDVLHYNDPHALLSIGLAAAGLKIPARIAARRVDFGLRSAAPYRHLCDAVVCVSRAVRDICAEHGIPHDRLHVVHDGVVPTRFEGGDRRSTRIQLGIPDVSAVILTVAKLTDHKGHRFLMESMPAIRQAIPNAIWLIAGEGCLRPTLEQYSHQLGLGDCVKFLGYRSDLADLFAAADLLAVPSHMEGLCSSIIDAMFRKLPILATTAGGIPDLLRDNGKEYATLVPPSDSRALAKAAINILGQPDAAAAVASDAYRRAHLHFSESRMVARTMDVYRLLLSMQAQPENLS